jgi:hypothetical protein
MIAVPARLWRQLHQLPSRHVSDRCAHPQRHRQRTALHSMPRRQNQRHRSNSTGSVLLPCWHVWPNLPALHSKLLLVRFHTIRVHLPAPIQHADTAEAMQLRKKWYICSSRSSTCLVSVMSLPAHVATASTRLYTHVAWDNLLAKETCIRNVSAANKLLLRVDLRVSRTSARYPCCCSSGGSSKNTDAPAIACGPDQTSAAGAKTQAECTCAPGAYSNRRNLCY